MASEPNESAAPPQCRPGRLYVVVLLLAGAALVTAIRMHAFDLPLETDECYYVYFADRLLAGDRLYVDVWDHQPPGVFVLFAAVIALFGDSPEVFRWMALAASLATMTLVFALANRVGGRLSAALALLLFVLCNADPGMAGEGCNREIFMNVFATGAVWLLLRRGDLRRGNLLASGLVLGLGSTVKTVMAAQWLLLALWLTVRTWSETDPPRRLRAVAARMGIFAAGPLVVWLVTFAYFAATGRLGDFFDAAFVFNLSYSHLPDGYFQRFVVFFDNPVYHHVFDSSWPLWIAAALALVALPVIRRGRGWRNEGAILCYLVGSFWAACLPGHAWPHYYYLMLPPLVIVVAVVLGQLAGSRPASDRSGRPPCRPTRPTCSGLRPRRPARWIAFGGAALIVLSLLVLQARDYLLVPTLEITDRRYDSRDLWARAQGRNVARVTGPDDTVFVYGRDAGIYYYSGRRCASRFTMVVALQDKYPGYRNRRAILLEDIETRRPRVVLLIEEPFPELSTYLRANYYLAGRDFHDRRPDQKLMAALMDNARPIEHIDWNWHRSSDRATIP